MKLARSGGIYNEENERELHGETPEEQQQETQEEQQQETQEEHGEFDSDYDDF